METFEETILDAENLIIPFNKAYRVPFGTRIGTLEQLPGRIWDGFIV
jgi:hypothetical protein